MTVQGKVVAVTGVTSGLGRAVATLFAQRGAVVIGCGRRDAEGRTLEAEIAADDESLSHGGRFRFVRADLTDPADCAHFVAASHAEGGRLDVLINNAGGHVPGGVGPSTDIPVEAWDRTMALNLRAAFLCARGAIELMRDQATGGVVLNVSSVQAEVGVAQMTAYNAAKAAVIQFSRSLAVEFVEQNVRVNTIVLGGVATDSLADVREWLAAGVAAADRRNGREPTPVATDRRRSAALRGQSPTDVARVLAALAGDDAALITGASIAIDRGITAGLPLSESILEGARIAAVRQRQQD